LAQTTGKIKDMSNHGGSMLHGAGGARIRFWLGATGHVGSGKWTTGSTISRIDVFPQRVHRGIIMFHNYLNRCCLVILFIFIPSLADASGLEIIRNDVNQALLLYDSKPVIAFGASPQNILTELPKSDSNDFKDWLEWAIKYKIKNVRSYPPSSLRYQGENVFQKSKFGSEKIDLNLFNEKYFNELRKACGLLKEQNVIVHLQFWQAVSWKIDWNRNYYNSKNNVNPEISMHAGPGEFVTMKNPVLLRHQKEYVRKILDATGDLGNVFYDIMNEIGNGTGASEEWVWEIIKTVRDWEKEKKRKVLLTLNGEGPEMGDFSLKCKGLDLIVKDDGRYEEHVKAKHKYEKPTISVRNIDYNYNNKQRLYFFGDYNLEVNKDKDLQARGRKYWWRMYMAGVQIAGGYADSHLLHPSFISKVFDYIGIGESKYIKNIKSSYRLNTIAEEYYYNFYKFTELVTDYINFQMSSGVLKGHPVANSYCLQSDKEAIIYLESPNGEAGYTYKEKTAIINGLMLKDGIHKGSIYFPDSGSKRGFSIKVVRGAGEITLPSFKDDLAIIIKTASN
jgi:hypothetical protein